MPTLLHQLLAVATLVLATTAARSKRCDITVHEWSASESPRPSTQLRNAVQGTTTHVVAYIKTGKVESKSVSVATNCGTLVSIGTVPPLVFADMQLDDASEGSIFIAPSPVPPRLVLRFAWVVPSDAMCSKEDVFAFIEEELPTGEPGCRAKWTAPALVSPFVGDSVITTVAEISSIVPNLATMPFKEAASQPFVVLGNHLDRLSRRLRFGPYVADVKQLGNVTRGALPSRPRYAVRFMCDKNEARAMQHAVGWAQSALEAAAFAMAVTTASDLQIFRNSFCTARPVGFPLQWSTINPTHIYRVQPMTSELRIESVHGEKLRLLRDTPVKQLSVCRGCKTRLYFKLRDYGPYSPYDFNASVSFPLSPPGRFTLSAMNVTKPQFTRTFERLFVVSFFIQVEPLARNVQREVIRFESRPLGTVHSTSFEADLLVVDPEITLLTQPDPSGAYGVTAMIVTPQLDELSNLHLTVSHPLDSESVSWDQIQPSKLCRADNDWRVVHCRAIRGGGHVFRFSLAVPPYFTRAVAFRFTVTADNLANSEPIFVSSLVGPGVPLAVSSNRPQHELTAMTLPREFITASSADVTEGDKRDDDVPRENDQDDAKQPDEQHSFGVETLAVIATSVMIPLVVAALVKRRGAQVRTVKR